MDFTQLATERYSVRDFAPTPLEKPTVGAIFTAAMLAPTARNNQPFKFYGVESEEGLAKIRANTPSAYNAPCIFIICADTNEGWKNPFNGKDLTSFDLGIVTTPMTLRAQELGVGSCIVGYFDPDKIKKDFNMPENHEPQMLLLLGYPAEGSVPNERHTISKTLSEVVYHV